MDTEIAEPSTFLLTINYKTLPLATPPENFQDQEEMYPHRHCHQQLLEQYIDRQCGWEFEDKMEAIGAQQCCSFDHVVR